MLLSVFLSDFLRGGNTLGKKEIKKEFGEEVAFLSESIARLADIQRQSETSNTDVVRDMLMAMAKDPRVTIVRLADRLHNMQTLDAFSSEKQKKYSKQTLFLCAPLAGRLGVFALKSPLEDLSFFYLYPNEYVYIEKEMRKHEKYRDKIILYATRHIEEIMEKNNIEGTVTGRIKHAYSIYKKMQKKQTDSVHDIYDLFAMRVLVPTITDCYTMLGLIHKEYTPLAGRFKDYIAVPKPNGYRSLHTTVVGLSQFADKAFPVEVQIRTFDMNQEAEFGMAAHWHYKEKNGESHTLAPVLDSEYSSFERTYAITPRGDIKVLPKGATPIDFAFSVHTDIGLRLRLSKANGKLVPLDYKIQNGDVIEIVTHKDAKPNQNWINMCVSNRTKQKIKSYLQQKSSAMLIREGRESLNKYLRTFGMDELDQNLTMLRDYGAKHKTKKEREELLLRIGNGSLNASLVARQIAERHIAHIPQKIRALEEKKTSSSQNSENIGVIIGGNTDIPVRRASCCRPHSGDKIVGFVTRGTHVTIHRRDCKTLEKLDKRRFISAYYETDEPSIVSVLTVFPDGDRVGWLHDILLAFREENVNVLSMNYSNQTSFSPASFEVEVTSEDHLLRGIDKIMHIQNVSHIKRD